MAACCWNLAGPPPPALECRRSQPQRRWGQRNRLPDPGQGCHLPPQAPPGYTGMDQADLPTRRGSHQWHKVRKEGRTPRCACSNRAPPRWAAPQPQFRTRERPRPGAPRPSPPPPSRWPPSPPGHTPHGPAAERSSEGCPRCVCCNARWLASPTATARRPGGPDCMPWTMACRACSNDQGLPRGTSTTRLAAHHAPLSSLPVRALP
mmetsp:Transcript_110657/g.323769  ORF Transcript_110657/g.323769 Transcript_110657/m.323769 type:complete len:206 (+) Transcript_110657:259-876(+)